MVRCPVCGNLDNPDDNAYCVQCGVRLPEQTPDDAPAADSGGALPEASYAAPSAEFEEMSRAAEAEVVASTNRQTTLLIAVSIALVLLFCACMCCATSMFFYVLGTS